MKTVIKRIIFSAILQGFYIFSFCVYAQGNDSIAHLNDSIKDMPSTRIREALAGKISSLYAQNKDSVGYIDCRCQSSFPYSDNQILLIDGKESSSDELARLQPEDILDFFVLKKEEVLEIYGERSVDIVISVNTNLKTEKILDSNKDDKEISD